LFVFDLTQLLHATLSSFLSLSADLRCYVEGGQEARPIAFVRIRNINFRFSLLILNNLVYRLVVDYCTKESAEVTTISGGGFQSFQRRAMSEVLPSFRVSPWRQGHVDFVDAIIQKM
jgi:hypothetical protein